jgi:predicted HicB family RNase H-like nuclease
MTTTSKTSDIAPFGVRMPEELKEYLKQAAAENCRSLNTEIIFRLEESRKSMVSKARKATGSKS